MSPQLEMGASAQCPRCFAASDARDEKCRSCGQRLTALPAHATPAAAWSTTDLPTITETPPPAPPPATAASTSQVVRCACGAAVRLNDRHRGKPPRCPKCRSVLSRNDGPPTPKAQPTLALTVDGPASRSEPAGVGTIPATISDNRFLKQLIAAIAGQTPQQADPPVLRTTVGGRGWNRLLHEVDDPHSIVGDVTVFYRTWIRKLAETRDERAVAEILRHVDSPRAAVQEAAITALAQFRDPTAVPALARLLLSRDQPVREAVVKALGAIRDARAVPPLVQLGVLDPQMRLQIHKAVQEIGESAVATLRPLLHENDPAVVLEATIMLGHFPTSAAVEGLLGIIEHPVVVIREQVIEALGRIGQRKAVPALIARLGDPEPAVRAQAALALAKLPDLKALPALHRLTTDADADVVAAAAKAVAELADKRSMAVLKPLLQHASADVRVQAARGLGEIGDASLAPNLVAAARDSSPEVRLQAIAGLRHFPKTAEVTAQLLESTQEGSVPHRLRAVQTLGEVRASAATPTLVRLLAFDPAIEVRGAAARALGQLKSVDHLPDLEEALRDRFFVKCQAIAAMAEIRDPTSLPVLLSLLRDSQVEVQYHAAVALGELGDERAMRPLELLMKSESDVARRGAAKALVKLGHPRGEQLLQDAARKRRRPLSKSIVNALPAPLVLGLYSDSVAVKLTTWGLIFAVMASPALYFLGPTTNALTAAASQPTLNIRGKVTSLGWTAEGKSLVVGRSRGQIEIWDPVAKSLAETIMTDSNGAIGHIFGGGSSSAVAFERDGGLMVRKEQGWTSATGHKKPIKLAQLSSNGRYAVTLGEDLRICVWDLHDLSQLKAITSPMLDASAVAVSNDGTVVAFGNLQGGVLAVELATNSLRMNLKPPPKPSPVKGIAFASNGQQVAVLYAAADIVLVDGQGQLVARLPHPGAGLPVMASGPLWFASNGEPKLYVGYGGTVVTWKLTSREATKIEGLQLAELTSVSPDGLHLATASSEGTPVIVYRLDTGDFVALDRSR
jgi:HEAT repeat protein